MKSVVQDLKSKRKQQIPESEYKDGPQGLKYAAACVKGMRPWQRAFMTPSVSCRYYDVSVGSGPVAVEGARVAVHYDAYWRGITFMTSRQGAGVTGGTPIGGCSSMRHAW